MHALFVEMFSLLELLKIPLLTVTTSAICSPPGYVTYLHLNRMILCSVYLDNFCRWVSFLFALIYGFCGSLICHGCFVSFCHLLNQIKNLGFSYSVVKDLVVAVILSLIRTATGGKGGLVA